MNKTIIETLQIGFEDIKKIDEKGIEYWEARQLMPLLEYSKWSNFDVVVIEKAKKACENSGQKVEDHFTDIGKMIKIATGTSKEANRLIVDYKLSRYACYLIAQNGDSSKTAIAMAQTYFAVQTRKQEIFQTLNQSDQRIYLRSEVKTHNKELNSTAFEAGVKNFGKFNNAGYLGLYGMNKIAVQKKKKIGKDDVLDRAGATELAANLFRITQTSEKIKREEIKGEGRVSFAHIVVGQKVRKSIQDIGGTMPEDMLPEPHIKNLESEKKKLFKTNKSSQKTKI